MPVHSRRPRVKPKKRSASRPSSTKPLASTTWTSDSGAKPSAATCRVHATAATAKPIVHHFELKRPAIVLSGRRTSTSGAATAPRWRSRKPTLVANADPNANKRPNGQLTEWLLPAGCGPGTAVGKHRAQGAGRRAQGAGTAALAST